MIRLSSTTVSVSQAENVLHNSLSLDQRPSLYSGPSRSPAPPSLCEKHRPCYDYYSLGFSMVLINAMKPVLA